MDHAHSLRRKRALPGHVCIFRRLLATRDDARENASVFLVNGEPIIRQRFFGIAPRWIDAALEHSERLRRMRFLKSKMFLVGICDLIQICRCRLPDHSATS